MCKNTVEQCVPRGFGYRVVEMRCGNTGIHGEVLLCTECAINEGKQYPQGWRYVPGDICPHGNYVGDAGGADHICGACEDGL